MMLIIVVEFVSKKKIHENILKWLYNHYKWRVISSEVLR